MPLVTAAGYPYHPIADTGPSPIPGDDYQRISGATPDAFGASVGQATERLGAQFEKSGDVLAEAAIQQQRLTNQVAANQSDNYVMDRMTKLMRGDPDVPGDTGFFGKQGKDAATAYPGAVKQMDKILEEARSSLANPRQQLMFDQNTRRMRNYWAQSLGSHYDQQLKAAAHNEAVAGGKIASQGLASAVANDDTAGESLYVERWMKSEIERVRAAGGSSTEVDLALNNIRGAYTRMKVETLANKDPLAARDYLEANKDVVLTSLNGHDAYNQLTNAIRKKAYDAQARIDNGYAPPRPGLSRSGLVGSAPGPHAADAIAEFKNAGWSDAAIQGAIANGQAEGGFHEQWKHGDNGTSFGHWQLHKGGELEGFQDFAGGAATTRHQAQYLIKRMEELHPGFGNIQDPKEATDIIEKKFERPKVVTGARFQGEAPLPEGTSLLGGPASDIIKPVGMTEEGNINLNERPVVKNADKTISTVRSISFNEDGKEVLIPTVAADGSRILSNDEAIAQYRKTGQFLGKFDTPENATKYAESLHTQQAAVYGGLDQLLRIPREPNELPDAEVPGLLGRLKAIDARIPKDAPNREARIEAAVKLARRDLNAAYTDQQHALRMKQEQDNAIDQSLLMEYQHRMTAGNVNYPTVNEVLSDSRFKKPESQRTLVGFIERETRPDPAAAISAKNTSLLFDRINREWGDPEKINDTHAVQQAFIEGKITKASYEFLSKQVTDAKTAEGEALGKSKSRLLNAYKHSITKSNPLMGQFDDEGDIQFGRFETFVDQQVDQYRKENKDPHELFNENSPNYLGVQARRFQKSLQDSAAGIANKLKPNPSYKPVPGRVMPRQPGETVDQYLKRTNK